MHEFIDFSVGGGNSIACEGGLVVSLTEEVSKNERCEDRSLEGDGSEEDTGKDHELGISHHFHSSIKVLFKASLVHIIKERI